MSERRKERKTDGTDWELVQMEWDAEEKPGKPAVPTVEQAAAWRRQRVDWRDDEHDHRGRNIDEKSDDPYHRNLRATRLDKGK